MSGEDDSNELHRTPSSDAEFILRHNNDKKAKTKRLIEKNFGYLSVEKKQSMYESLTENLDQEQSEMQANYGKFRQGLTDENAANRPVDATTDLGIDRIIHALERKAREENLSEDTVQRAIDIISRQLGLKRDDKK